MLHVDAAILQLGYIIHLDMYVMFSPGQQVRSLQGLLKITTWSRNLFEVSCYKLNIIKSYLWLML